MHAIGRLRAAILAGFTCLSFQVFTLECDAEIYTLSDGNSIAQINPSDQTGMFNWSVNGQNQLNKQWFWYSVGSDPERSIDTISDPVISDLTATTLTTSYYDSANRFNLSIFYSLIGGSANSGTADITEQIRINNTSGSVLPFHFYQYSDFDIGGTPDNDTIVLSKNGFTHKINQADQFDGDSIVEVVNTPNALHGEADVVPNTLTKLNDYLLTTLDDSQTSAFGDVAWALQWDVNIAKGGSYIISKDKHLEVEVEVVAPEPGTLILLGTGLLGLLAYVWRKRK